MPKQYKLHFGTEYIDVEALYNRSIIIDSEVTELD